jgi:hypothetical protein
MLTYEKALIPQNKIKNLPIQAQILKLPWEIFNKMGHFLMQLSIYQLHHRFSNIIDKDIQLIKI